MKRIWAILDPFRNLFLTGMATSLLVSSLFSLMAEEVSKAEPPPTETKSLTSWEEKIQPIVDKIEILKSEVFNVALWRYVLFALVVLAAVILSNPTSALRQFSSASPTEELEKVSVTHFDLEKCLSVGSECL